MEKSLKPIIIFGSSKSRGQTWNSLQLFKGSRDIPIVELSELNISFFDYEHKNQSDDYIPLMERVLEHDPIILATPVYWYTMSAQMKVFIDRLSDCLAIRKDIGRKLKGKKMYVITTFSTSLPEGFEEAFRQTCDYMDMSYQGCLYCYTGNDAELRKENEAKIAAFTKIVLSE